MMRCEKKFVMNIIIDLYRSLVVPYKIYFEKGQCVNKVNGVCCYTMHCYIWRYHHENQL